MVDLFWEKGFAATSVGDIVERTGLSKSSLYGAFGSKDELYQTALYRYLADHHAMITGLLVEAEGGLEAVDAFLDRIWEQVDCFGEDRGCLAVNTATELGSSEPAVIEFGARHREFLRAGFTAALQRAVGLGEFSEARVADAANVLVTTALGVAVMIRGGASPAEIKAHLDSTKLLLRRS